MKPMQNLERMVRGLEEKQHELMRVVAQFGELQKQIKDLSERAGNDPAAARQFDAFVKAWNEPDGTGKSLKEQTQDVMTAAREADHHGKVLKKRLKYPRDAAPTDIAEPQRSSTTRITRRFA
ncbi:hypothetical protein [Burkholderia sp. WSM2232]|uniref:hypothetical protein n=1 Tax=Burkholderia sp. WSM2232 TaxID=944436 RepID=UPI00041B989A|nr:hypothetical protein [Burkholderia sp. WSM2232]